MIERLRELSDALASVEPGPDALDKIQQTLGIQDSLVADPDKLYATPEEAIKAATQQGAAENAAINAINDFIVGD
jgi:hypothetical protein